MDFTALDFETANHRRDSACQIGIAVVREGKIVDRHCRLIRPEPLSFNLRNIEVHGIRPHHVQKEPSFGELWSTLQPYLTTDCLIAHNASFDMGVLLSCLQSHGCQVPRMEFNCTRLISRATWPGRSGYGLKPLSSWLGVRFQHHDALEDAVACAKILLAASIAKDASSLPELEHKLRLQRGYMDAEAYQAAGRSVRPKRRQTERFERIDDMHPLDAIQEDSAVYRKTSVDLQRLSIRAGFIRSLRNLSVACTGQFASMSREELERLIVRSGGVVAATVNQQVSLVVVGNPDPRTIENGRAMSIKETAARALQASGHPIRLINETEFLQLIQSSAGQLT